MMCGCAHARFAAGSDSCSELAAGATDLLYDPEKALSWWEAASWVCVSIMGGQQACASAASESEL